MRILLVNDTGARENPGCQLTSRSFAAALTEAMPDARIGSAPWGFARRLGPLGRAARRALSTGRGLLSEPALHALAVAEYGAAAVDAARDADLVLFQPEGTISDDHGPLRILRHLSLPLWAVLHGPRPAAVANGTFPLFDDERRDLISLLLARADHAALRDRLSAEHWGARFAPDSAVLWTGVPRRSDHCDGLLLTTGAEVEPARDMAIARAGLAVCRGAGLRPVVLTKGWRRFADFRDEVTALGGRFVERIDLEEADRQIASCRLHVGGRYHMALLCATKGVPSALVRTNTHKNLWLAADFRGIDVARDEQALADLAGRLLRRPVPDDELLADVAGQAARLRTELSLLPALASGPGPARPPVPELSPALASRIVRDARGDLVRAGLRRLIGRG